MRQPAHKPADIGLEPLGHILYRMSFSSIIRESQDLGAGLFDTEFNTLCESESTPLHIGSLPGYLAGIEKTLQGGRWHDDDGRNRDVRLPIKVCVRVKGDGIEVDLTGSSDQVETGFNVPFEGSTKVACFCAIRSLLLDAQTSEIKVPSNQGSFRPIEVIAPKGSIYNPNFPAAAEARFSQINRVIDLIYKALRRSRRCCRTTSSPAARRASRSPPTPG